MSKKVKRGEATPKKRDVAPELWLAQKYNLKGPLGDRAWDSGTGGVPSHNRYLELADIALGLKKPAPKNKPAAVHDLSKKDPYVGH